MATLPHSTDDGTRLDDDCVRRLRDLSCWWSEVGASLDCPSLELRQRLQELRPHLARQLESRKGPENPLLLADLDQLIMRLGTCTPGQMCWINLSHAIGVFLSQLQRQNGQEENRS